MKLLGKIEQAQDAVSKEYVDGLVEPEGGGVSPEDLETIEIITAAALNHLESEIKKQAEKLRTEYVTQADLIDATTGIKDIIVTNEQIIAAALGALYDRIKTLERKIKAYEIP